MSDSEQYEGWTNRETWAVALHINNDQGWQENLFDALRDAQETWREEQDDESSEMDSATAGTVVQDSVEEALDVLLAASPSEYAMVRDDLGSLWRVNWDELGAAFLRDLREQGEYDAK